MTKLSCELIQDLLPLYVDQVCSEESKRLVDEHLAECVNCYEDFNTLTTTIHRTIIPNKEHVNDGLAFKKIANSWNKSKKKALLKGILIATISCALLLLAYIGLFQWKIIPVSTDIIEITDVYQLSDGRITYHVNINDDYDLNRIKFHWDKSGNSYKIPYRPIIKSKRITENGLFNTNYVIDPAETNAWQQKWGDQIEIKAWYFGSEEDNILIWQEGMEVPPASEELEKEWGINNE